MNTEIIYTERYVYNMYIFHLIHMHIYVHNVIACLSVCVCVYNLQNELGEKAHSLRKDGIAMLPEGVILRNFEDFSI